MVKAQPVHNQEVLKKVFRLIFRHLDALFHTRQRILCADGQTQECYPVLSASTAIYFESIHLHSVNHPNCLGREAPKSLFGEGNTLWWQLNDDWQSLQRMILTTLGDKMERWESRPYLLDRVVWTPEANFWNMKCISLATVIIPNILHTINLGTFQHLMDRVMSFLEQHARIDKFNQLSVMIPPYPGFARFNKPYSQVTQCSGKQMNGLGHVIVPVSAATLLNPLASQRNPFTKALLRVEY